jgi:hypothetical protein
MVTFNETSSGTTLDELNFREMLTLPRVGDTVVLPKGQRGRVQTVVWRLDTSRIHGAAARVHIGIALEPEA